MVSPKKTKAHTTKWKNFHIDTLHIRKRHLPTPAEEFSSKVVLYRVSSYLGNHRLFLGSHILSHPSGSNDFLSEDEYDSSSIYGIPLHRWIDHACGYTFRHDDRDVGFSFQKYFLPPTHIHEFYFIID
jgi:hypothetical protein